MEAQINVSEPETNPQTMDSDSPGGFDELNFHEIVNEGSLNFEEWISLITKIERVYPDNIEKICLVYDSFLSEFPLCHGYWRRYAGHKARLCDVGEVVEVFERALQLATYSVGVWVDYCNFSMLAFEDPSDIRRLFRRGLSYVGKDYLCHALWDKYIDFELSQQQWSLLAHIYVEALRFPTKKLHRYYDSFKKLANLCTKEVGCEAVDSCSGSSLEDEVPKSYTTNEISSIINDLLEPSINFTRSKSLLQKYLYTGEQLYREACQLEEKISTFEMKIRRSYFHVKSLDVDQLENWHRYLDFVGMQGDFDWAVKLYEKCLIPCANYPEFWMRYAESMERKGGREIATYALNRATQIFLKRVPAMHLFNARFKEHDGDTIGARAALLHCDEESDSNFVENVARKANMERRLGNFVEATNIYEEALKMAELNKNLDTLPILYVHFSRLKYMITENADAARDILIEGIKRLPSCILLLEELINFATLHGGQRHIHVIDSVIANVISPGPDASQGLNVKDAEDVSSLYLKFVDLCGTIDEVRKAWNRHVRLFPYSFRTAVDEQFKHEKSSRFAKEGREINIVIKHQQPPEESNLDSLVQMPLQDKEISEPKFPAHEIHDIPFEQTPTSDQLPSEEAHSDSGEKVTLLALEVTEQSKKDSPETNVSSVDLVYSPSSSLKLEVAEGTESLQTLNEHPNGNDHNRAFGLEPQRDMKPLSLEGISLHPQAEPSSDSKFSMPQETCISDESMVESNQPNNDEDHRTQIQRKAEANSPQIENEVVNPSSSKSYHNPTSTKPRYYQQSKPANRGKNWHRANNSKVRKESKFGFQGHLQRSSHQHRKGSTQQQHPQAGLSGLIPIGQVIPSQIASPQSHQILQGSQSQIQFQITSPPPPVTWPVQSMAQPNYVAPSQPVQGSEEQEIQNNQAYNQMWQYYYYQQQMLMQQQPQQQNLNMSQEYQQQYLQWQQQQYLYQQQLQQQPQQPDTHQLPQQPQQEAARQDQQQQQSTLSKIQEWNQNCYQQDPSLELDGSNQSGVEPAATHNMTSHSQDEAKPPLHTSSAREASETVTTLNSIEQSPAKKQ
ncbi:pre-mRNA-processing factor 39-2 isoform X1 [Cannabis sativa]|uniref:pre-mRNA-processing factor 39-2 isoform X1 n=2 Tax=Cannabis sativa TaxID=3483 RepID=UPI0029CA274B|nr:pre-mRNA-processing factor 39-2 isoform X1 [Cannabis sativa]